MHTWKNEQGFASGTQVGTVLLLGACGSAGINFARCVRSQGWKVVAVDSNSTKLAAYKDSEFDETVLMSDKGFASGSAKEAADFIMDMQFKYDVDVVHAQPDVLVKLLYRCSQIDSELRNYMFPHSFTHMKLCEDKMSLQKKLVKNKSFHESVFSGSGVGLFFGNNEEGWLRLRKGAGSQAALPVRNEKQAKSWMSYWITKQPGLTRDDFVIAPILPGREFAVQALYSEDGIMVHMQARQRNEYFFADQMPSGQSSTPSIATITSDPEIYAQATGYLHALAAESNILKGIYGVDMKEDKDGKCIMTEINYGRFYTTSMFFAKCGVNTPLAYLQMITGTKMPQVLFNSVEYDHKWVRTLDAEPRLIVGGHE